MTNGLFGDTSNTLNLSEFPVHEQKAFYGALFAMAASDNEIDRSEMELIFETLDIAHLNESDRREIHSYVITPPDFDDCIAALSDTDEVLRYGLMLNLIEVMIADDIVEDEETEFLHTAEEKLGISDEQVDEMIDFAEEVKRIRERGIDDEHAADVLKQAAAGLTGVGVPIAAVSFSGSVVGLSAAGITSGLAALGLGLGMVSGIGVAIAIGAGIYAGLNKVLDTGNKKKKAKLQKERQRKAQLAIQNLQETISTLIDRLQSLQTTAADAEANKEAIQALNSRLHKLKGLLSRREKEVQPS